jgi:hypothetical protein
MKNKYAIILLIASMYVSSAYAQSNGKDTTKTVALQEVNVEGSRIIRHAGYDLYLPTKMQREHSANGFDLLQQMQLPGIMTDQVEKTVNYTRGSGKVVIKINNVVSTVKDLLAITPNQLTKVEYSTMPSMKYGQDAAAVINIRTKRNDASVALGINSMNALTYCYNDDGAWLKASKKRSEFGLLYNFKLNDISKAFNNKEETFRYDDGKTLTRNKAGDYSGGKFRQDDVTLTYNYAQPEKRVIDMKLSYSRNRFPQRCLNEDVTGDDEYQMQTFSQSDEKQIVLKTYYDENISKHDEIEVSMALAYLDNAYKRGFSSPNITNLYDVCSEKYSMRGEMEYSHTFENESRFATGYQQSGAYTANQYKGNDTTQYDMNNNSQYVYAEYSGTFSHLNYTLGIGLSREHFSQNENKYTFYSWQPKVTLQYGFNDFWSMSYHYQRSPRLPSLADLTDYLHQDDDRQITVGNPDLKPYDDNRHSFVLDFKKRSTNAFFYAIYEYAINSFGNSNIEERDGFFWHTLSNGINLHHFESGIYVGKNFLNNRINAYIEPKVSHDDVSGSLHHRNTNVSVQIGCATYYKSFSFNLYYRSPFEMLSGNILQHNYSTSDLNVTYTHKALSARIGIRNVFSQNGKSTKWKELSDKVSSVSIQGNRGFGNMVYISLSWNLMKGRQHKAIRAKDINVNMDSGIVK